MNEMKQLGKKTIYKQKKSALNQISRNNQIKMKIKCQQLYLKSKCIKPNL